MNSVMNTQHLATVKSFLTRNTEVWFLVVGLVRIQMFFEYTLTVKNLDHKKMIFYSWKHNFTKDVVDWGLLAQIALLKEYVYQISFQSNPIKGCRGKTPFLKKMTGERGGVYNFFFENQGAVRQTLRI